MDNYYDILGVTENATDDDIKKAYRKKSKEYHPDVNPSGEDTFKKISVAYDVLSDKDKRGQYDFQRKNPNNFGDGFGMGVDPWEIFERMRGGFGQRRRSVPDKTIKIDVSVVESFLGLNKTLSYNRKIMCEGCDGSGGDSKTCSSCGGRGVTQQRMGNGMFTQIISTACGSCKGKGKIITNPCHQCSGTSTKNTIETFSITVPIGIDNGQFLRIQNKGDFQDGSYGDLVIQINIVNQDGFEKEMNNLIYTATLDISDLSKDNIEIPHPDGPLTIRMPEDFDSSIPLRIKGKGFRSNHVGDLYVKLRVKFKRKN